MNRALIVAVFFVLVSAAAAAETVRLSAKPGEFNPRVLGKPSGAVSFSARARLVNLSGTAAWPPAAYVGVHQGPDRNESLQVLAIRNKPEDNYLVVGYRLVVGGKEVKVESLANVPLHSAWEVRLKFQNGLAVIGVNGGKAIEVQTPFKVVAPYVSVSSGEAEFNVDL